MPRTKPAMSRPSDRLSSMANSSAIVSGLETIGSARPITAILTSIPRVRSIKALVMLVHADAVEADLGGKDELVDVFLVEPRALLRIVVRVRQHHPVRPMRMG